MSLKLPTYSQVKGWLDWELQRLLNRSWRELFRLLGLLSLSLVFIVIARQGYEKIVQEVIIGFVGLLLLHPFLRAGEPYVRGVIPRRWLSSPVSLQMLAFSGVLGRWFLNLIGLVVFVIILSLAGFSFAFLLSPLYWLLFLLLLPGTLGLGLFFNGLGLWVGELPFRGGVYRAIELLGAVFFRPFHLPAWLYGLSWLVPHTYLNELARDLTLAAHWSPAFYIVGIMVSLGLLAGGTVIFFRHLDDYIQSGQIFRS